MIDRTVAAGFAWLVQYAMDMTTGGFLGQLTPLADPRLAKDWKIIAYLQARDVLFRLGPLSLGEKVCYGFLAQSLHDPLEYVAVVRGTYGLIEWLEDGRFLPVRHPDAGTVESGFWGIYTTMQALSLDGKSSAAAPGIAKLLPAGAHCTVIGHSLGSTLATYLAYDLAKLKVGVTGYFFASPKTGSQEWCGAFDTVVGAYDVINYIADKVPLVPDGLDYQTLPREFLITPANTQALIRPGAEAAHHILCYGAQLDWHYCDWKSAVNETKPDLALLDCILGPSPLL